MVDLDQLGSSWLTHLDPLPSCCDASRQLPPPSGAMPLLPWVWALRVVYHLWRCCPGPVWAPPTLCARLSVHQIAARLASHPTCLCSPECGSPASLLLGHAPPLWWPLPPPSPSLLCLCVCIGLSVACCVLLELPPTSPGPRASHLAVPMPPYRDFRNPWRPLLWTGKAEPPLPFPRAGRSCLVGG